MPADPLRITPVRREPRGVFPDHAPDPPGRVGPFTADQAKRRALERLKLALSARDGYRQ